jgi:hypothetical protein
VKTAYIVILQLLLILCVLTLQGCSSNHYFEIVETPVTQINAGANIPELPDWQYFNNQTLAEQCHLHTQSGNTVLTLSCANALLSRDSLFTQQKSQGIIQYNHSLQQLVSIAIQQRHVKNISIEVTGLNFAKTKRRFVLTSSFNIFDPRLKIKEFGELGILAVSKHSNTKQDQDKFYPLEGIYRTVNFQFDSLTVNDNQYVVHLSVENISSTTDIYKGNNLYHNKYSLAAPYLSLLEEADIDTFSLLGLVQAAKAEFRRGVFAIEPISSTKIPIIMVHGLNSDPLIWRYLTVALLNDEKLSNHFQIWHLYYPSGPPPFYTAMKLRQSISNLLASIHHPGFTDNAVFIGHSMGGIIANVLTTDSDYALWDAAFVERPETLIDKPSRDLENIFMFTPLFKNNTVFFLDTPHRGSEVATSFIGYLSSSLVNLPQSFIGLFQSFTSHIGLDKLTKAMQPFMKGPNSIQVLRPGHPLMNALNELPIAGKAYSIIGSETDIHCLPSGNCAEISDGVVSYNSANISQAEEEIIVHATHNSFQNEQAITFIQDKLHQLMEK